MFTSSPTLDRVQLGATWSDIKRCVHEQESHCFASTVVVFGACNLRPFNYASKLLFKTRIRSRRDVAEVVKRGVRRTLDGDEYN